MANVGLTSGDPQDSVDPNASAALDQSIAQGQAQADLQNELNQYQQQQQNYQNLLNSYGGSAATKYAPYDVGGGKTKWDEFVQQMQLENEKLTQAQDIENARLAQEKSLAEEKLQEEQKIADQNTVEAYNKNLEGMSGPKDPYGYLFASRGLSAPQGYAPTAAPIPQAVLDQYKSEGVDLQQAQQQLVGGSGPSFISGYLGSMPNTLQQGPMGFQNSSAFKNVAPGSTQQPTTPPPGQPIPGTPPQPPGSPPTGVMPNNSVPQPGQAPGGPPVGGNQPLHAAQGLVVPGYAPGQDSVPAMLSPGEGVLKPQAVQAMGGPSVVQMMNQQNPPSQPVQRFADGGIAQPVTPTQSGSNYQIAGQNVGQNTVENSPPPGYSMTAPGVANATAPPPPVTAMNGTPGFQPRSIDYVPGQGTLANWPGWLPAPVPQQTPQTMNAPQGTFGGAGTPMIDPMSGQPLHGRSLLPGGIQNGYSPFSMGTLGLPTQPNNGSLLTGGVLTAPPPAGQQPINLNMLDPYTRSMVDQYGVPQIPSAQALADMPQSGKDAYQNYVEKVAGGNFQDLLDQSKSLNSNGATAMDFHFT